MRRILIVGALLVWAPLAWSVSKVGTGKVSNDENGFTASIPPSYSTFSISNNQNLTMEGSPFFRAGNGSPERRVLLVYLLSNQQPELVGKVDRAEFVRAYELMGWLRVPHRDSCVEQLQKRGPNGFTRILSWGGGLGVQIATPDSLANDARLVAETLEIEEGFCAWR